MILLKRTKWLALGLCGALLLAALTACSADSGQEEAVSPTPIPEEAESVSATPAAEEEDAVQETAAPDETADAGLILAFTLLDADGAPLSDASLQLTIGEDQADYPAEEDGTLTVSGLPRTGTAELVLTDASGAELGTLELQLSEGSVTDAVDNGDGTASLTVLTESAEAALTLAMGDGGTLTCSLTAAEPSAS